MLRSETTIQSAEKINHFNYSTTVRILYCFRSRVFATGNYIVTTTEWSQVSSSTFWWTMPHVCGCGVVEGRCCTCTAKIQFNQWHTFSNFLILCVCVCVWCVRDFIAAGSPGRHTDVIEIWTMTIMFLMFSYEKSTDFMMKRLNHWVGFLHQ